MKFRIKKASNGQFRFNIVASNGQIVATSETYTRFALRRHAEQPAACEAGVGARR